MTATSTSHPIPNEAQSLFVRVVASAGFALACYGIAFVVALVGYRIELGHIAGQDAANVRRRFLAGMGDFLLLALVMWLCHGITLAVAHKANGFTVRERVASSSSTGVMGFALTIGCLQLLGLAYANSYVPTLLFVGAIIVPTVAATLLAIKFLQVRQRR